MVYKVVLVFVLNLIFQSYRSGNQLKTLEEHKCKDARNVWWQNVCDRGQGWGGGRPHAWNIFEQIWNYSGTQLVNLGWDFW